jgi:hypothetical protein
MMRTPFFGIHLVTRVGMIACLATTESWTRYAYAKKAPLPDASTAGFWFRNFFPVPFFTRHAGTEYLYRYHLYEYFFVMRSYS